YRHIRIWPQHAVGKLKLQTDSAEANAIVGVEIERNPTCRWKQDSLPLVTVLNATDVSADVEPPLRIDSKHPRHIEPVAGWNVVRELTLGLRDRDISAERKARRNLRLVVNLRARAGRRCENASSAQYRHGFELHSFSLWFGTSVGRDSARSLANAISFYGKRLERVSGPVKGLLDLRPHPSRPLLMTALDNSYPALRVQGLRKAYDDVVAVDGLNLEVETGECFGLLGPNGAGKTTTIEICEGLLPADSGSVEVLGRRWESDGRELRELLGIQLQDTQLSEKLTVDETLTLFQSFYRDPSDVGEVIDKVELGEKRYSRVGMLSGGQKQRLAVACALVGNPQLLFLDEPTTGLDPQSRRQFWELIEKCQSEGRTIVLTTHYMEEAERLCDRVAIVDHGHVIALGSPRELTESLDVSHLPPPEPRKTTATLEDVFVS